MRRFRAYEANHDAAAVRSYIFERHSTAIARRLGANFEIFQAGNAAQKSRGQMKFVAPWREVEDEAFDRELEREAVEGHVLYGIPVATIARRDDTDDVLFALLDGTGRVAEVHLTWAAEADPKWPAAQLFADLQAWEEKVKSEHADSME